MLNDINYETYVLLRFYGLRVSIFIFVNTLSNAPLLSMSNFYVVASNKLCLMDTNACAFVAYLTEYPCRDKKVWDCTKRTLSTTNDAMYGSWLHIRNTNSSNVYDFIT